MTSCNQARPLHSRLATKKDTLNIIVVTLNHLAKVNYHVSKEGADQKEEEEEEEDGDNNGSDDDDEEEDEDEDDDEDATDLVR